MQSTQVVRTNSPVVIFAFCHSVRCFSAKHNLHVTSSHHQAQRRASQPLATRHQPPTPASRKHCAISASSIQRASIPTPSHSPATCVTSACSIVSNADHRFTRKPFTHQRSISKQFHCSSKGLPPPQAPRGCSS